MDSKIAQLLAAVLVAILAAYLPLALAFRIGFVYLWWGQDAESYFGLLLVVSLPPVLLASVASLSIFYSLSATSHCQRWFFNGAVVGSIVGICLIGWIDQHDRLSQHPWLFHSISLLAACGMCVLALLLFNRVTDRYSVA